MGSFPLIFVWIFIAAQGLYLVTGVLAAVTSSQPINKQILYIATVLVRAAVCSLLGLYLLDELNTDRLNGLVVLWIVCSLNILDWLLLREAQRRILKIDQVPLRRILG